MVMRFILRIWGAGDWARAGEAFLSRLKQGLRQ
jgi:hypothetical protein